MTNTTRNIPTPIPASNIPPIAAQPDKGMSHEINKIKKNECFFMVVVYMERRVINSLAEVIHPNLIEILKWLLVALRYYFVR